MQSLPIETIMHIVNELNKYKTGPRRIVDYRMLRVADPGDDGRLRQLSNWPASVTSTEALEDLLRRGYSVLRTEWRPIPEGRQFSELWAHVVLYHE